jgi:uncharacterized protein (TIGR02996 family)
MSAIAALEAHIRTHPDDWPSWLVYADHLLDQGDPRGALVRLDRRLAQALTPDERERLQRERASLVEAHGWERLDKLRLGQARLGWRHGFLWSATLGERRVTELLSHLRRSPSLQLWTELVLVEPTPLELVQLASTLPDLPVDILRATYGPGDGELWGALAGSLIELHLCKLPLWGEQLDRMLEHEGLARLSALSLEDCGVTGDAVAALAEAPTLRGLRALSLAGNRLTGPDLAWLASAPALTELVKLDLSRTRLDANTLFALALAEPLNKLACIKLSGVRVSQKAVRELARLRPSLRLDRGEPTREE